MIKSSGGYTLIEIIVVITIAAILSGIGLFSLNTLNRRQVLVQNTKKIISEIRLTKSLADAQQKPLGCETLNGYKYSIVISGQTSIKAICTNSEYLYKQGTVSAVLSGMTGVFFPVLQQPAEFTGSNQLTVTQNGQVIVFSVSVNGTVAYE